MRKLVYTMFISNNRASFHFYWKENLVNHQKVSKYHENVCRFFECGNSHLRITLWMFFFLDAVNFGFWTFELFKIKLVCFNCNLLHKVGGWGQKVTFKWGMSISSEFIPHIFSFFLCSIYIDFKFFSVPFIFPVLFSFFILN